MHNGSQAHTHPDTSNDAVTAWLARGWAGLQAWLASVPLAPPHPGVPPCVVFVAWGGPAARAQVELATGDDPERTWAAVQSKVLNRIAASGAGAPADWLRVEIIEHVEAMTWAALRARLARTKRNYFRFGLALDASFAQAILEYEIHGQGLLYDASVPVAHPHPANLRTYGERRFGRVLHWPTQEAQPVWRFRTRGVFVQGEAVHRLEPAGQASGYRQLDWGPQAVRASVRSATAYLARQVDADGRYAYGWFACFDRPIPHYNALRHASSTYALIEGWTLAQDPGQRAAIERALTYLTSTLIRSARLPGGGQAAFLVDEGDEVKLGGNAVSVLALTEWMRVTGERTYLPLCEQLALGMLHMQEADTGAFVHVLHYPSLQLKARHRIIYYDGEAAFALMRLYGMTGDARWIAAVERAFAHFIAARHWQAHDHWLSYCVDELTRHRPEARYYQFGLDNVRGHLDFVMKRITTYPTLLELMMATHRLIQRLQADGQHRHLLDGFDLATFQRALEHRARYLMNGFFWPELAMFFANPQRVVGSFFIRHHGFRVRIDDVEHYLSGLVAYLRYREAGTPVAALTAASADALPSPGAAQSTDAARPSIPSTATPAAGTATAVGPAAVPAPTGPVVAWGGDVNLGRRQHYRAAELGMDHVLCVPALTEADLTIVNLECVVATTGEQGVDKGEAGPFYYRARPQMLDVLTRAGVDLVSTANNHAGDYGPQALTEQAAWLAAAGIGQAGSGAHREAAFAPVFRRAGSLVVAVFAVDTTQPGFAATDDAPGVAYLPPGDPAAMTSWFAPRVALARQHAHVVLVAVHAGPNGEDAPRPQTRALARALIDAGFDAVLGASAHRLQGVELHQGRPILHDAGDLLFDAVRNTPEPGGVFRLTLDAHGVRRVTLVPVGVGFGQTRPLTGASAQAVLAHFQQQCAALGTAPWRDADMAVLDLAPPARRAPAQAGVPAAREALAAPARSPYAGGQVDSVPAEARMPPLTLGPLTLLGVRVQPAHLVQRGMLWIESFWSASAPVDADLRLNFQAVPVPPSAMPSWGRAMDHDPCDWMRPTSGWVPGVIYRDWYGLRPPPRGTLASGELQLHVGLAASDPARRVPLVALPHRVTLALPAAAASTAAVASTPATSAGPASVSSASPAPASEAASLVYRTEFPAAALAWTPGATWTAESLAAAVQGQWLGAPPPGWQARSVVMSPTHMDHLPTPMLFVASEAAQRQRHEQFTSPRRAIDHHDTLRRHARRFVGALVSRPVPGLPAGFPVLQVQDPVRAVIELGLAARARYPGPVVAVTGTVGKSTTVGMLAQLLGSQAPVLTSIENFNSRVGVPATLASLAPDHAAAVIEVAQSALWMARGPITRQLRPTIAVITEMGLSQTNHRVRGIDDVVRWKTRVFDGLTGPAVAVVGEHLPQLERVVRHARAHARDVLVYGRGPDCTVRYAVLAQDGRSSRISVTTPQGQVAFTLPVPGEGAVRSAVAACAVLYALDKDLATHVGHLADYATPPGRMDVFPATVQGARVQVIDDSYNAEVASMLNAFSVLGSQPTRGRRVAVLGRIVHLGDMAHALHQSLADPLQAAKADVVLTHGEEMLALRDVLPPAMLGPHFTCAPTLLAHLVATVQEGDCVLIKGSRRDSDFGDVATGLQPYRDTPSPDYPQGL